MLNTFFQWISIIAGLFTIGASGIAIYVYFSKRKSLKSMFRLLLSYSYQLSISEIKEKLERLNDHNANDTEGCEKVVNLMHEIIGQIRGNNLLKKHFSDYLKKLELLVADKRKLTEPRKRAAVSELRERLRHLNINIRNIDEMIGEPNE